ncbi:SIMPL domain-containing protein [Actimicrobium antarcticum]|uniref:SIMPL domain-containing protein n=1 Tax=Actimicrobium antarcticum TaxID=1051899 RepID=A0ABP7T199_9BURK
MSRLINGIFCIVLSSAAMAAQAQVATPAAGTLLVMPAEGDVKRANDQATATLMIEEQDKDKSVAASRVNQKMKQGTEIIKREDPRATLTTRGYYTYPVYSDEPQKPSAKPRQPVGWRVGQSLDIVTTNLAGLPKTVAAAQRVLALNGLAFSLSEVAARKLDDERIAVAINNLNQRIAAAAKALGRNPADAVIESIDFEGASSRIQQDSPMAMKAMRGIATESVVEEPSFEPGETTLRLQVVGKVRFK